jgi:hypothetical protein
MEPHSWIAISSLLISVITALFMIRGQKQDAKKDYAEELEARIAELEREIERHERRVEMLESQVKLLTAEKIALLAKLAGVDNR